LLESHEFTMPDLWPIVWLVVFLLILYSIVHILWVMRENKLMRKNAETGRILQVLIEADSDVDILEVEQMWNSFYNYLPRGIFNKRSQNFLSFEVAATNKLVEGESLKEITFNFWAPDNMVDLIKERVNSSYPFASIRELPEHKDHIPNLDTDNVVDAVKLTLEDSSAFSIRQLEDLEVDPLQSIMGPMSSVNQDETAVLQVMLRPTSPKWNKRSEAILKRYEKTKKKPSKLPFWLNYFNVIFNAGFRFIYEVFTGLIDTSPSEFEGERPDGSSIDFVNQEQMLRKVQTRGFETSVRILVESPLGKEEASNRVARIANTFEELRSYFNGFKISNEHNAEQVHELMKNRYFNVIKNRDVLTSLELKGFLHLANKDITTRGIQKTVNKMQDFPNGVSTQNAFASSYDSAGEVKEVGLDILARMRHVYITGMTGVGKSTLLENMIINDIETNKGCVVVDPHGDLIDSVIEKINPNREDVYVLDPSDINYPFGLNLLELSSKDKTRQVLEKTLVIDAYITVMQRVFGEAAIGPNTDDIFRMSCSAIIDHPEGGGLLEMLLILVNDEFRNSLMEHIRDPIVKSYWRDTFAALVENPQFRTQNLNPPLNKIRRFLGNEVIANIICQKKSSFDLAEIMNSGGVILARFSRGDIGFENSALLGTMLISKIQIAAMQRVAEPEDQRTPTFLYVDEFQNFVGDEGGARSFSEILSEARKYRLGLIIAHQYLDQLKQSGGDLLINGIFNNTGTLITFRVGPTDAQFFETFYYDEHRPNEGYRAPDIANLDKFTVIIRVMTKDGTQSHPFTAFPFPPIKAHPDANPDVIIERSRRMIASNVEDVRSNINSRASMDTHSSFGQGD